MELYLKFFFSSFILLFTIINPFASIPIFLGIVKNATKEEIIKLAKRATFVGTGVLIIFALIGNFILEFFGITIGAFKIAGGILIARVGFEMLYSKEKTEEVNEDRRQSKIMSKETLVLVPLAIPMLSGPGAINTTIDLISKTQNLIEYFYVYLALIFVFIITYYLLVHATYIEKILGENGKLIFFKIIGLLIFVIGIQFMVNGVHSILIDFGILEKLV